MQISDHSEWYLISYRRDGRKSQIMCSLSTPFNQNGKCVVTPRKRSHAPKKNLSLWSYQRKYFRNIFVISVFCTSNLDKSRHVQGQGVPIISIIWMSEEKNNDYKIVILIGNLLFSHFWSIFPNVFAFNAMEWNRNWNSFFHELLKVQLQICKNKRFECTHCIMIHCIA